MSASPSQNVASLADMYERVLVEPLFQPWVYDLFERVRLTAGNRVLDVACGLASSRERRNSDWREGHGIALPVGAGEQFDAVFCRQLLPSPGLD